MADIRSYLTLMETVTYATLFTEGAREDFLLKTYGSKITDYLASNHVKEVSDARGLIDLLGASDPSNKKLYTQWLLTRFLSGTLRLEDLPKAERYLSIFDANKSRIQNRDIAAYKSLPELLQTIQPFVTNDGGDDSKKDAFGELEPEMLKQAKVILDDGRYRVLIPLTKEASCYFGHHTEWCTAYGGKWSNYPDRSENMFDHYGSEQKLFVILDKSSGERWQLYLGNDVEFKDQKDAEIENYGEWFTQHPELAKLFYAYNPLVVLTFDVTVNKTIDREYEEQLNVSRNVDISKLLGILDDYGTNDNNGDEFSDYGEEDDDGMTINAVAHIVLGKNAIREERDSLDEREFTLLKRYVDNNFSMSEKY